ncbi:MAG: 2-succinyl-5-enolpyruvyl-6-hydroxy-3-cyclohexene-1-carboxylic-acid synthase [Halobacteriales archaeon]|nr:2-succinyl-5-enolpyruvyl-6-hydroxy-3-cyclohexene-1-carboxylic-acid synthase [Halobacteriales archaeon]
MTAPNRNTLWGRAIAEELAGAGIEAVCIAPGSRSTPLTVAFADHDRLRVYSHLDERSAAYFALGRAKTTGTPTPLVCTSGTAAANFHPAVIEANQARVPMVLLTADRPPELHDSGANQTIDQEQLYGDAVRWYRTLPEPEPRARKLRSLRTTVVRAVATSMGTPPGPVHLNVPFRKPLEPTEVPGDVPETFDTEHPIAANGRPNGTVDYATGQVTPSASTIEPVCKALRQADRGLIVLGPANHPTPSRDALADLADATGFPILADPLSGGRFGEHVTGRVVCGGYDAYLDAAITAEWPEPDVVLRFGASPTSKQLRQYLERTTPRQFMIDPAGEWREATFSATDVIVGEPTVVATQIAERCDRMPTDWADRFTAIEERYWEAIDELTEAPFEGQILRRVVTQAPDPSTLFVSNSMPVRDLDRFGQPQSTMLDVYGNRGASGIDGITSTALGVGSTQPDTEPLILVTGDLAYYHDMNGLLAIGRCDVDATIVEINNDGGGIFHLLPIEEFDPPFTEQFKTPHGLDFEATGDLYDVEFERVEPTSFASAYARSLERTGTQVIEVLTDARASHRVRERLQQRLRDQLG